jgi:hypothetical protein
LSLGPVIFRAREFRKVRQLIVEWILALVAAISILTAALGSVPGLAVGLALLYVLYRLRVAGAWTRRVVEIFPTALKVGDKVVPWDSIREIRMVATRMEPGLIIGDRIYSYEEVVEAEVVPRNSPPITLRLKMEDFGAFLEYAKSRMGVD